MYHFREPTNEDLPFIVNSWLKSGREGLLVKPLSNEIYFQEHKRIILALLNAPESRVVIAADDACPTHILGWACGARPTQGACGGPDGVLHFVYVKHLLRRQGLARQLVQVAAGTPRVTSHLTPAAARYLSEHPGAFEFNPYLLCHIGKGV